LRHRCPAQGPPQVRSDPRFICRWLAKEPAKAGSELAFDHRGSDAVHEGGYSALACGGNWHAD
jgi:hypothetical protein